MDKVRFLTIYAGTDIYAIEVGPEHSGWEEAQEEPPVGTHEKRLNYICYLASLVQQNLFSESVAKPYLDRLREVANTDKPFAIPVVDENEKVQEQQAKNEAYLDGLRAQARALGMNAGF